MMYGQYVSIHGYGIGPLHLLIVAALIIVPFWQLFTKAGEAKQAVDYFGALRVVGAAFLFGLGAARKLKR